MTDLSQFKIPLEAKNSNPVTPSSNNGGNISYRDKKGNDLIDSLQTVITDLTTRVENLENNSSEDSNGVDSNSYVWTGDIIAFNTVDTLTSTVDTTITEIKVTNISTTSFLAFYIDGTGISNFDFEADNGIFTATLSTPISFNNNQVLQVESLLDDYLGVTIELITT